MARFAAIGLEIFLNQYRRIQHRHVGGDGDLMRAASPLPLARQTECAVFLPRASEAILMVGDQAGNPPP